MNAEDALVVIGQGAHKRKEGALETSKKEERGKENPLRLDVISSRGETTNP